MPMFGNIASGGPTTPRAKRWWVASSVVGVLAIGGAGFGIARAVGGTSAPAPIVPGSPHATTPAPTTPPNHRAAGRLRPIRPGAFVAAGPIATIASDHSGFTISTRAGTVTVKVTSSTVYRDASGAATTFSSLHAGDVVRVAGNRSGATVTATSVVAGGPGRAGIFPFAAGNFGVVETVDAANHSFTMTTRQGTVTVDTSSSTTFRSVTGSASFSSVTAGARVAVTGPAASSGTHVVKATTVVVLPARGPGGRFPGAGGPGAQF